MILQFIDLREYISESFWIMNIKILIEKVDMV